MHDVDTIFESPFPSETTLEMPEYDDVIHECPPDYDEAEDAAATEALLYSLGVIG